jgi:hypothetical protein
MDTYNRLINILTELDEESRNIVLESLSYEALEISMEGPRFFTRAQRKSVGKSPELSGRSWGIHGGLNPFKYKKSDKNKALSRHLSRCAGLPPSKRKVCEKEMRKYVASLPND